MSETINRLACVLLLYRLVGSGLTGCAPLALDGLPEEALAWRLRAIDSTTVSIDMETFLRKPDRSGLQIPAAMFQFR